MPTYARTNRDVRVLLKTFTVPSRTSNRPVKSTATRLVRLCNNTERGVSEGSRCRFTFTFICGAIRCRASWPKNIIHSKVGEQRSSAQRQRQRRACQRYQHRSPRSLWVGIAVSVCLCVFVCAGIASGYLSSISTVDKSSGHLAFFGRSSSVNSVKD